MIPPLTTTPAYIRIRTPDDLPGRWTAEGDLVPGMPYQYISGDVEVQVEWRAQPAPPAEALRELVQAGDNVNKPDPGYGDWRRFNTALDEARRYLASTEEGTP